MTAVKHTNMQSKRHHQHTNTQLFTGQMPFLLPIQQHYTEGKVSHSTDLLAGDLTTKGSWLHYQEGCQASRHLYDTDISFTR